jgi:hypothetical protein
MNVFRRILGALAVLATVSTALVGLTSAPAYARCVGPGGTPCIQTNEVYCWETPPNLCKIHIRFAEPATVEGEAKVATIDATAIAREDYEPPVEGVLAVPVGSKEIEIDVQIVEGRRGEPDEEFYLVVEVYLGRDLIEEMVRVIIPATEAR